MGADINRYAEGHDCDWLKPLVLRDYAKGEALHEVCAKPGYPSVNAVMFWLDTDATFAQFWAYAKRARTERTTAIVESVLERLGSEYADLTRDDVARLRAAADGFFRLRQVEGGGEDPGNREGPEPSQHNHIHITASSGLDLSNFPPQREPPKPVDAKFDDDDPAALQAPREDDG